MDVRDLSAAFFQFCLRNNNSTYDIPAIAWLDSQLPVYFPDTALTALQDMSKQIRDLTAARLRVREN
jgi:hypothetical protein